MRYSSAWTKRRLAQVCTGAIALGLGTGFLQGQGIVAAREMGELGQVAQVAGGSPCDIPLNPEAITPATGSPPRPSRLTLPDNSSQFDIPIGPTSAPTDPVSSQAAEQARQCDELFRLSSQGEEQLRNGQLAAALRSLEQYVQLYRELNDVWSGKEGFQLLGSLSMQLGDYARALNYYQQYLALIRQGEFNHGEEFALRRLSLASAYLGDYPQALAYAKQSLELSWTRKRSYNELLESLQTLGIVYTYFGESSEATVYYQSALQLAQVNKDRFQQGNALSDLGNAYFELENYPKALGYYQQSLVILEDFKDKREERGEAAYFMTLSGLGRTYTKLGNHTEAIASHQKNVSFTRRSRSLLLESTALNDLGIALMNSGKLAEAESQFREAMIAYEAVRYGLPDAQKVAFAETRPQIYNNLQQVLIQQNQIEAALEVAERSRARAFAELLAQRTQGKAPIQVEPIAIATMKRIAREQQATLVEYANLYDETLYIYVVQPTGKVTVRPVSLKPLVQRQTSLDNFILAARCLGIGSCETRVAARGQSLVFNLAETERLSASIQTVTFKNSYLQGLHDLLINPIADLLPTHPQDRVIFIPQGSLFLVPFAALQDPQGSYLIDRHTIAIAPSIQVLQLTRQQRQRLSRSSQGEILLVGNPLMPRLSANPGQAPAQLPSLPGAEQEARAISQLLQVPALIGAAATKSVVLNRIKTARIVHLATHGLLNDFDGLGIPGAIALAPDRPGEVNNGLLTANELLNLQLQAELVVLSACDTGRGRITGDGVIGLSRALITAGVPSVMVSLWAVPDAPTADLMSRFYQNLNQGQNKATALRQAMLATRAEHPDPVAWASFVLIGEAE